jgi:hypothetical protein
VRLHIFLVDVFLIFIADIESSLSETIEYHVHHDNENYDLQSAAASSSSPCKVPLLRQLLLDPSSLIYTFPSSEFQHLLRDHGIPIHETDLVCSQMGLLHHLMNGLCVHNSNIGCRSVVNSSDAENLALAISEEMLDAPLEILRVICKSLGYHGSNTGSEYAQLLQCMHS